MRMLDIRDVEQALAFFGVRGLKKIRDAYEWQVKNGIQPSHIELPQFEICGVPVKMSDTDRPVLKSEVVNKLSYDVYLDESPEGSPK